MIKSVVEFSLKQKVFFNLVFILLTVAGFFALSEIPTERFPNVYLGEANISTYYPGASPTEVETLVTRKIEETLEGVENIEWISATSYPERSQIRLKFVDDSDYDALYTEVRLKVLNMMGELPAEADPPEMKSINMADFLPVIAINLGGSHNNRALALIAEQVKTKLQKIPKVKEITVSGEFTREFHINLDPEKLRVHGISFDQVSTALQNSNISVPAGSYSNKNGEYLIKVDEKFHNREQVVKTIIRRDGDGGFIRLQNLITHADLAYRDPVTIFTINGENVVVLKLIKTSAGNALEIKQQVEKVIQTFQPLFDREQVHVTLTHDSTIKINDGITTLSLNMALGMLLVSLIVWYFMGFRNAGLVTIGIPFSFMITMVLMHLTGNSLNELTLFSFVLVTGIIVDDAIVVCENIYRHIQEGEEPYHAIVNGVAEVALPVITSTLTTIAAFLPMLVMSGSTGEFFALIPTAVSYALIGSLVECLFILPIHYLDFGPRKNEDTPSRQEKDNLLLAFCRRITLRVLKFTLHYRWTSVLSVFLLLFIAIGILAISASGTFPLIRIKFFPDDYAIYYVDVKGPSETPIFIVDKKVREISQFIAKQGPGFSESAAGYAGFYVNEDYEFVYGNNFGTVQVTLPAKDLQQFEDSLVYLDNIRHELKGKFENKGYTLSVHAQKEGPPAGKDINVRIVGSNFSSVTGLADKLYDFLSSDAQIAPNLIGLEDDRGDPKRIYRFNIRHDRVHEYNLNSGVAARLAGGLLDGRYIGKYRLQDDEIDIKVLIDPETVTTPQDALNIPFIEHPTGPIRLGDVADLQTYKEQGELHRYQNQRSVSIKANLLPDATTSTPVIVNAVKSFYSKIHTAYPGTTMVFGGEHEDTQRSYTSLAYAFIMAVLIMYLILATQFQSYLQPIIILSAIIFTLIGVVFGKMLTQSLFTVNSFIAVIGVAGVVVNDSLMLIDFMNKHLMSGATRLQAIEEAIRVRLRPILLTTLTTTLGLLPMALGIPEYSLVWGSMASTFVTGLAAATILTLFIVPVLWDLILDWQERPLLWFWGKKKQQA